MEITDGMFRLIGLNMNGFQKTAKRNKKNDSIRSWTRKNKCHVLGMSEPNEHWKALPIEDRLYARTKRWYYPETMWPHSAYYEDWPTTSDYQSGGVAMFSFESAVARKREFGQDKTKLGRWCWVQYHGQEGKKLRVISAYRPVWNTRDGGSTYMQHKYYYDKKDQDKNPRQAAVDDLAVAITEALEDNAQVAVIIDGNEDVRNGYLHSAMAELGLMEAITSKHGNDGPPTRNPGSVPIDGIYVTPGLMEGARCGYLAFGNAPYKCDHRATWLEININHVFGNSLTPAKYFARRLKCGDPRVVKKYADNFANSIKQHGLLPRARANQLKAMSGEFTAEDQKEWEAIDKIRIPAMKAALKKCRKLKMGGVPWSPKIQALIDKICAWNLLFRRRNGANINGRHLRNCFKQAKLDFSLLKCSRKTVIEQLDLAISTFRVAAKTADQTRADFRIDLAKAIEKREKKKGHKKANWRTTVEVS